MSTPQRRLYTIIALALVPLGAVEMAHHLDLPAVATWVASLVISQRARSHD